MAIILARPDYRRLTEAEITIWRGVSSCAASDAQNRGMALPGAIGPLRPGMRIFGQARTVLPSPGDNACVLTLSNMLQPGEVMVVAGCGPDVAMAGELVGRQCRIRGAEGLVIDGAVRDSKTLADLGLPIFCLGRSPRGPVKEHGGFIDVTVGIGGISIAPGDLIIGDCDGVTVVPLQHSARILRDCERAATLDLSRMRAVEGGRTLADVFGLAAPTDMPQD